MSKSRFEISSAFIDDFCALVIGRLGQDSLAKGTVKKIITSFLKNKLIEGSKSIKINPTYRNAIKINEQNLFRNANLVALARNFLEDDSKLEQLAPILASVSKAMLEIYNEELEKPGRYFNFKNYDVVSIIPEGLKFMFCEGLKQIIVKLELI